MLGSAVAVCERDAVLPARCIQIIRDNAVILYREAGNIEAGNADLSDRASAQAAALEQTAASMEEIMFTVSHYAENACEARELAGRTASTTYLGAELMRSVVTAMGSITEGLRKNPAVYQYR